MKKFRDSLKKCDRVLEATEICLPLQYQEAQVGLAVPVTQVSVERCSSALKFILSH